MEGLHPEAPSGVEAGGQIELSVIIATRNRRESLERLVASLRATRDLQSHAIEILIVDNGSTDGASDFLAQVSREWPVLRVFSEPRAGKNFALNKGIREAKGNIFCFMDDDIVMDKGWLNAILTDYEKTRYDGLQPRVLPGRDPQGNAADTTVLYRYNIPVIDYGDRIKDADGLTGVIMSVKRAAIVKIGNFDERLPASGYHGDTDLSRRIREAGFSIGYTPHVVAYHELNPNRYGIRYARLGQYQKGLTRSLYSRDSVFGQAIPNIVVNGLRYVFYRACRREEKIYKTEKRIMKYTGYVIGRVKQWLGMHPWQ
jgi:glucosyl-dolichyl phosphate glucuronosyltransferase